MLRTASPGPADYDSKRGKATQSPAKPNSITHSTVWGFTKRGDPEYSPPIVGSLYKRTPNNVSLIS